MARKTLISGGLVATVDPTVGTIAGDILVEDDVIVAVGQVDPGRAAGAEIIDATEKIAMPGFVDVHRHTWQSAIRHRNGDRHECIAEAFKTPFQVFVLIHAVRALTKTTIVMPARG